MIHIKLLALGLACQCCNSSMIQKNQYLVPSLDALGFHILPGSLASWGYVQTTLESGVLSANH